MLNKRIPELHSHVWRAAATCGHNAGKIADAIISDLFPRTVVEAEIEGADKLLRSGLVTEVNRVLKSGTGDDAQMDFGEIAEAFRPLVSALNHRQYFVEARDEHVPVAQLIADPKLLNDARGYMRRKGDECHAEAEKLDQLYAAVMAVARQD